MYFISPVAAASPTVASRNSDAITGLPANYCQVPYLKGPRLATSSKPLYNRRFNAHLLFYAGVPPCYCECFILEWLLVPIIRSGRFHGRAVENVPCTQ